MKEVLVTRSDSIGTLAKNDHGLKVMSEQGLKVTGWKQTFSSLFVYQGPVSIPHGMSPAIWYGTSPVLTPHNMNPQLKQYGMSSVLIPHDMSLVSTMWY